MNTFEMKVSIDPAVNLATEIERVAAVVVAQIQDGQSGAEVLNTQGDSGRLHFPAVFRCEG